MKRIVILTLMLLLVAGCVGLQANSPMTAVIVANADNAATLRVQAQAGTLTPAECLAVIGSVGETAKTLHAAETTAGWAHAFQGKGILISDPAYVPPFLELVANRISAEHQVAGRWATSQPTAEKLNILAGQACRDLVIVQEMKDCATTHVSTVRLQKIAVAPKRAMTRAQVQSLADIIASKMPSGWLAAYNTLPAGTRILVEADLPIVAAWASGQLKAWWANYLAGDTVAARVLVLDSLSDDARIAVSLAAGDNAEKAINTHVDGQVAGLNAAKDVLISLIPMILGLIGL